MIDFSELSEASRGLLARRAGPEVYEREIKALDQELQALDPNSAAQEISAFVWTSARFRRSNFDPLTGLANGMVSYAALIALGANPDLWITLGAAYGSCDANEMESGVEVAFYVFETPALWVWAKARKLEDRMAPNWRAALKQRDPGKSGARLDFSLDAGIFEEIASFFERLCATLVLVGAPGSKGLMEEVGYVGPALEALTLDRAISASPPSSAVKCHSI